MTSSFHLGRPAKVAVAFAAVVGVLLAALSARGNEMAENRVRLTVPLWRDVPVADFAVLRQGNLHGTQWGAYIFRDSGRGESRGPHPCIVLSKITRGGVHGSVLKCGPVVPRKGGLPVFALIGRGGPISESFISMVLPSNVRRVRLGVEPGEDVVRSTSFLGERRQTKAHLGPLRYVAFALPKDICVDSITGYTQGGRVVLNADAAECPLIG